MAATPRYASLQELFADPARWTQGAMARNAEGAETYPEDPLACSWCLVGGLWIFPSEPKAERAARSLARIIGGDCHSLGEWNDDPRRTHSQVLDAVTRAGV